MVKIQEYLIGKKINMMYDMEFQQYCLTYVGMNKLHMIIDVKKNILGKKMKQSFLNQWITHIYQWFIWKNCVPYGHGEVPPSKAISPLA